MLFKNLPSSKMQKHKPTETFIRNYSKYSGFSVILRNSL